MAALDDATPREASGRHGGGLPDRSGAAAAGHLAGSDAALLDRAPAVSPAPGGDGPAPGGDGPAPCGDGPAPCGDARPPEGGAPPPDGTGPTSDGDDADTGTYAPAPRSLAEVLAAEEEEDRRLRRRRLVLLAVGLPVAAAAAYMVWTLFFAGKSQPQRQVINTVTRIALPPPPPPPPPPRVDPPPPEPPRVQEQVQPKPEPKPEQPRPQQPPSPPLGLGLPVGPGGANPYGIGAGSVDGTVVGGGGVGGGGGGNRFGSYGSAVTNALQRALQADERTRRGAWRVTVRIWVGASGQITRAQLVGTSGDPARDTAIRDVLNSLSIPAPPNDLPQPIIARIDSRA
jgi:TonB family protein